MKEIYLATQINTHSVKYDLGAMIGIVHAPEFHIRRNAYGKHIVDHISKYFVFESDLYTAKYCDPRISTLSLGLLYVLDCFLHNYGTYTCNLYIPNPISYHVKQKMIDMFRERDEAVYILTGSTPVIRQFVSDVGMELICS
jgi:hypothetical protein